MVAEPGHWAERQAPGLIAGGRPPQEVPRTEGSWGQPARPPRWRAAERDGADDASACTRKAMVVHVLWLGGGLDLS